MSSELDRATKILSNAGHLVVVTGAGMSKDSGVPTFRDAMTGLWSQYDPMQLANESAFRSDPSRVFGWYVWRWNLIRDATPHAGYHALVALADRFEKFLLVTQNVDGFHRRSGSKDVVELHGSLDAFRCLDGGHPYDSSNLEELRASPDGSIPPPKCPLCGSPIRPGVVWFGESLPQSAVERAWSAVEHCDAMLVVGTSAVVYPAAELPSIAIRQGIPVVDINPGRTPISDAVDVWWAERAEVALPALLEQMEAS